MVAVLWFVMRRRKHGKSRQVGGSERGHRRGRRTRAHARSHASSALSEWDALDVVVGHERARWSTA